ncbi:MAG: bifunctional nuclease family protein [Armatimonadetes bacterium]|jgi:hypothetical protein|nr:bifunctional nuclease family protein [Armatimonadota bacterium]MDI9585969.1 bifunctional nuclease family protein [Acidobacteriota bacterium]
MVEMHVHRVLMNPQGQAFVLLEDPTGDRLLPIWIGQFEATAIAWKLEEQVFERPLTHDLFINALAAVGYEIVRVDVTKLENRIFYALLTLTNGEEEVQVDSRPSDALALAVRADADIFVAEQVLDEAQILRHEIDENAEVEKFRELIESGLSRKLEGAEGYLDDTDEDAEPGQTDMEDDQ